jgi:glucuronate isomerase
MVINHAGSLKKEYFTAYMKMVMNAFECPVERAKELTFQRLFGFNEESMGKETYQQFLLAYEELKEFD